MLHAASLSALNGIRHAFFTRTGGVSQGVYPALNGGIGMFKAMAVMHRDLPAPPGFEH